MTKNERKENKIRSRKKIQKVIKEVEDLILSKRYSHFTISSIQNEFNSNTENSYRISISTCRRILKEDLKYSYKRCCTVSLKTLTPENIRWYHESVVLLSKMKQEDVEVIFFDGFLLIQESGDFITGAQEENLLFFQDRKWIPYEFRDWNI